MSASREAKTRTSYIIAENEADARAQSIDAVGRDRVDRGLADATQHAAQAVRGLVDDGPVKFVNTEIAALTKQAEDAEQWTALWQQAADRLPQRPTCQSGRGRDAHSGDGLRRNRVTAIPDSDRSSRADQADPSDEAGAT